MQERARSFSRSLIALFIAGLIGFGLGRATVPGDGIVVQSIQVMSTATLSADPTDPAQPGLALPPGTATLVVLNVASGASNDLLPTPTLNFDGTIATYTVQVGDSAFRIAERYGITLQTLIDVNGLVDASRLIVGQELVIPIPAGVTPLPFATATPILSTPQSEQSNDNSPANVAVAQQSTPTPLSLEAPENFTVNGLPHGAIILMNDAVRQNIREIYTRGLGLGRNPQAFSKIGDSTIENPHFLARFDQVPDTYNLGQYADLQPVIEFYGGSFGRQGSAVQRGMHSWTLLDPMWAGGGCLGGESPVECEIRLHNPSVVLIRIGSNDVGVPGSFDRNMREVVEYVIAQGVVPVIGTKADRNEGSNVNNDILRQIANDYLLPLWDYDTVSATIPGRGLDGDGVHMTTFFAHDYTQSNALQTGHGLHNLTALVVLDAVWRELNNAGA